MGGAWLLVGRSTDTSASLAALGQAPGIAPPDYAYLDNARVALYLGQLEGGIATSENLTQQLTKSGTAGLSVGGNSLGGSVGSTATAERVVTPTATARFYQLLDLLEKDNYLETVDMSQPGKQIAREFGGIQKGSFVRLENCTVQLPNYVQLLQAARSPGFDYGDPLGISGSLANPEVSPIYALKRARAIEKPPPPPRPGQVRVAVDIPQLNYAPGSVTAYDRAIHALVRTVGSNPRVPMATCNGSARESTLRGVDLLFPIQLAEFTPEPGLLGGPVTVVGKLVLAVRNRGDYYIDNESLTTFDQALDGLDGAAVGQAINGTTYVDELVADAVVLAPGAVIIPIAIYR